MKPNFLLSRSKYGDETAEDNVVIRRIINNVLILHVYIIMRTKAYARLKVFSFCIEEEFLGIMGWEVMKRFS